MSTNCVHWRRYEKRGRHENLTSTKNYHRHQDTLDLVCRDQLHRRFYVVGVPVLESDEDSQIVSSTIVWPIPDRRAFPVTLASGAGTAAACPPEYGVPGLFGRCRNILGGAGEKRCQRMFWVC